MEIPIVFTGCRTDIYCKSAKCFKHRISKAGTITMHFLPLSLVRSLIAIEMLIANKLHPNAIITMLPIHHVTMAAASASNYASHSNPALSSAYPAFSSVPLGSALGSLT